MTSDKADIVPVREPAELRSIDELSDEKIDTAIHNIFRKNIRKIAKLESRGLTRSDKLRRAINAIITPEFIAETLKDILANSPNPGTKGRIISLINRISGQDEARHWYLAHVKEEAAKAGLPNGTYIGQAQINVVNKIISTDEGRNIACRLSEIAAEPVKPEEPQS